LFERLIFVFVVRPTEYNCGMLAIGFEGNVTAVLTNIRRVDPGIDRDGIMAANCGFRPRSGQASCQCTSAAQTLFVTNDSGLPITTGPLVIRSADERDLSPSFSGPLEGNIDRVADLDVWCCQS